MQKRLLTKSEEVFMNILWERDDEEKLSSIAEILHTMLEQNVDVHFTGAKIVKSLEKKGYIQLDVVQFDEFHLIRQCNSRITREEHAVQVLETTGVTEKSMARLVVAMVEYYSDNEVEKTDAMINELQQMIDSYRR